MLRIIAYDIADKLRLRRVAKCCERYGGRIEKSVFELNLDTRRFTDFWRELSSLIDDQQDAVVAYPVCATCEDKILMQGNAARPEVADILFF